MKRSFLVLIFLFTAYAVGIAQNTVQLSGQVVCCADCWMEADRTKVEYGTSENLSKAISCIANGDPTLLAVREGDKFTLYQLEQGKFKLTEKDWHSYVGKTVSVSGTKMKLKKADAFVVDTLEVTAPPIAEREALSAVGKDAVLALKDLTGAAQSLASFKGRVVVLNFWATWCEPCKKEMPDLSAIQNDYAALGVQVIGAAGDELAESAKVLKFVREFKVNFPVWVGATTGDMQRFGVGEVLPATVIVDKDGKIAWREIGIIKPDVLRKELDKLLLPKVNEAAKAAKAVKAKTKNASLVPA